MAPTFKYPDFVKDAINAARVHPPSSQIDFNLAIYLRSYLHLHGNRCERLGLNPIEIG